MRTGKLGCIVQARTTSSRLPNKVLKTLDFREGTSILEQVIFRLKAVENLDYIIVATTTNSTDDQIELVARQSRVEVFRGSENDVLERYYLAATEYNLSDVIRITSDCPFIDPAVIDELILLYQDGDYDYASNTIRRTYPHGLDCEIFSMEALEKAYKESIDKFYREHVTSYMYTHREKFKIGSLELPDQDCSGVRITVDTKQDYALACAVEDFIGDETSFTKIVDLISQKPYLALINEDVQQKRKYYTIKEELDVAYKILEKQELNHAAAVIKDKYEEL